MTRLRDLSPLNQLDLFRPPPTTPDWEQFPPDVRHKAVSLLARLIRPRRRADDVADHGREAADE
jgi:hypothetical protein